MNNAINAACIKLGATHVEADITGVIYAFRQSDRGWESLPVRIDGTLPHEDWNRETSFNPDAEGVEEIKAEAEVQPLFLLDDGTPVYPAWKDGFRAGNRWDWWFSFGGTAETYEDFDIRRLDRSLYDQSDARRVPEEQIKSLITDAARRGNLRWLLGIQNIPASLERLGGAGITKPCTSLKDVQDRGETLESYIEAGLYEDLDTYDSSPDGEEWARVAGLLIQEAIASNLMSEELYSEYVWQLQNFEGGDRLPCVEWQDPDAADRRRQQWLDDMNENASREWDYRRAIGV